MPGGLSLLIHQDPTAEVKGLDELAPTWGEPPVWLTFQAYHAMVAIGMTFIGSCVLSCLFWWRGTLFGQRWLLWYHVFAVLPAFAANELGWVAAEVGRQPWVVYPTVVDGLPVGGLRTSDTLSEAVRAEQVLGSIVMFGLIYALLFIVWIVVLTDKIVKGPEHVAAEGDPYTGHGGLMDAASGLADHHQSLTQDKDG